MYHLATVCSLIIYALRSGSRADKRQQPRKQIVRTEDNKSEKQHYKQHDTRVFEYGLKAGPCNLFKLRPAFYKERAQPFKYVGLFGFNVCHDNISLLRFLVNGVLFAESAILVAFQSVGCGFAVFVSVVVALFAFGASKYNLNSVTFFRSHSKISCCAEN